MTYIELKERPTKEEQAVAKESYAAYANIIGRIKSETTEIAIEETGETIHLPLKALRLLGEILQAMGEGKPVSIVPLATELTTQAAADFLGCSRPHLVSLLEEGKIPFTKVGKHRRIKFENLVEYKKEMKKTQKKHLIEIIHLDEESGLYDL